MAALPHISIHERLIKHIQIIDFRMKAEKNCIINMSEQLKIFISEKKRVPLFQSNFINDKTNIKHSLEFYSVSFFSDSYVILTSISPNLQPSSSSMWHSDVGQILRPLIKFGWLFGSNWQTNSKYSLFRWILILYSFFHYPVLVFLIVVSCSYFDNSEGVKGETMIKLAFLDYCFVGVICHTSNLNLQSRLKLILEKGSFVKASLNKRSIRNKIRLSLVISTIYTLAAVICVYIITAGPMKSPLKPLTFGFYELTVAGSFILVFLASAFAISTSYTFIFCSIILSFCDHFHQLISGLNMSDWNKNYNLFLDFVDLMNEIFCWYIFFCVGLFFVQLVVTLLMFANVSELPLETAAIFFFWAMGAGLAITLNLMPVIHVNEKVLLKT